MDFKDLELGYHNFACFDSKSFRRCQITMEPAEYCCPHTILDFIVAMIKLTFKLPTKSFDPELTSSNQMASTRQDQSTITANSNSTVEAASIIRAKEVDSRHWQWMSQVAYLAKADWQDQKTGSQDCTIVTKEQINSQDRELNLYENRYVEKLRYNYLHPDMLGLIYPKAPPGWPSYPKASLYVYWRSWPSLLVCYYCQKFENC